jgi:hypothetical protein
MVYKLTGKQIFPAGKMATRAGRFKSELCSKNNQQNHRIYFKQKGNIK